MPFLSSISTSDRNTIRAGGYSGSQYLLACPNDIVFQAQVNQSTFTDSFAEITYDNVTTGSYTAAKEGYTVYIGASSGDIRSAYFVGRVRKTGTPQKIYINQTSADISDNDYIMVVKDIRASFKLPRALDDGTVYRDYDITFRKLKPVVKGLQTAYVAVLSGGNADYVLQPTATAMEDGASISSWAWDSDGATFQAGSASTQNVTLRYTTAGHYMPRVTVTDSNGNTSWFSPHIFVVPADYSSVVDVTYNNATINRDIDAGHTLTISAFDGIESLADRTFIALWSPSSYTAFTNDVQFVGRFRQETNSLNIDPRHGYTLQSQFTIEGIATQLASLNGVSIPCKNSTNSTAWGEIDDLTPVRAAHFYLSEHTTLPNICCIDWHDSGSTYIIQQIGIEEGSVSEAVRLTLQTLNARLEYAAQGEIRSKRETWMLTDRSGVTTIEDFELSDVNASGGAVYDIQRDPGRIVGRVEGGGGFYREADDKTQAARAVTPAITPDEGDFKAQLNSQVLAANVDISAAFVELGGRNANWFARQQPLTMLNVSLMDGWHELIPSVSDRYTWTITAAQNPRGIAYSTSDYWQLTSVNISYDNETGRRIVDATFTLETAGSGYRTQTSIPYTEVALPNPIQPTLPPYPYSPPPLDVFLPDPDNIDPLDYPPVLPTNPSPSNPNPQDVDQQRKQSGDYGLAWSSNSVFEVNNISLKDQPDFNNVTPSQVAETVVDAKFDKVGKYVYVLENETSTPTSWVYRTKALGQLAYIQSEFSAEYKLLRPTYNTNQLYVYGSGGGSGSSLTEYDFTLTDGNWNPTTSVNSKPQGIYAGGVGWQTNHVEATVSGGPNRGVRLVQIEKTMPSTTVTGVRIIFDYVQGDVDIATSFTSMLFKIGATNVITKTYAQLQPDGEYEFSWTGSQVGTSMQTSIICGIHASGDTTDPGGQVTVKLVEITTPAYTMQTQFSTDGGASWGIPISAGSSGNVKGADVLFPTTRILVSGNSIVRDATDGGAFSDTTGGGSGEPECIAAYGDDTLKYLYATTTTLYQYDGSTANDITPNDGVNNGVSVGANCIAVARGIETHYVAVLSFGGVRKVAYTTDGGSTWSFNTQIGNSATYARMKYAGGDVYHVMVIEGSSMWYSQWTGSGTLTFTQKTAPASLIGFEWYE